MYVIVLIVFYFAPLQSQITLLDLPVFQAIEPDVCIHL